MALPRDTDRGGSLAPHRPSREIYGAHWAPLGHQSTPGSCTKAPWQLLQFICAIHSSTDRARQRWGCPSGAKGAVSEGHEQGEIPQYRKNKDAEPDWE